MTGTVQADVRVTGLGRDPHLNGYVDLQNGAFDVVPAGDVVSRGMTTRIELQRGSDPRAEASRSSISTATR